MNLKGIEQNLSTHAGGEKGLKGITGTVMADKRQKRSEGKSIIKELVFTQKEHDTLPRKRRRLTKACRAKRKQQRRENGKSRRDVEERRTSFHFHWKGREPQGRKESVERKEEPSGHNSAVKEKKGRECSNRQRFIEKRRGRGVLQ